LTAKPLCAGSIPTRASIDITDAGANEYGVYAINDIQVMFEAGCRPQFQVGEPYPPSPAQAETP
jgi:hypothetical protein